MRGGGVSAVSFSDPLVEVLCNDQIRWDACLTLRFQTGSCMLLQTWEIQTKWPLFTQFIPARLEFSIVYIWRADAFSASQIDFTPQDNQMRANKHQTGASSVFSIGSWSAGLWTATSPAMTKLENAMIVQPREWNIKLIFKCMMNVWHQQGKTSDKPQIRHSQEAASHAGTRHCNTCRLHTDIIMIIIHR